MPCPPQVPISIIPPVSAGQGPLVWQNGSQITRLNKPLNPSWLVYDGSQTRWGDGSAQAPVYLPNIQQVDASNISYILGSTSSGQIVKSNNAVGTNLIGGAAGEVVYQVAPSKTGFTAQGTTGQLLQSNGTSAPTWTTDISNNTALATGATTPRTLANRFADVVNVLNFGADPTGATDNSAAFSLACNATQSGIASSTNPNVALSPRASVYVPAGNYLFTNLVNTYGKEIVYHCENGTTFLPYVTAASGQPPNPGSGLSYINGRIVRDGIHFESNHFGFDDTATTLSLKGNPYLLEDELAYNNSYQNPSDISAYTERDTCTFILDNRNPSPTINISSANYTATTIVPSTPLTQAQILALRVSMIIDTKHTTQYSGFVTSWASDGTSITVSGWFQLGNTSSGQVPPNGTGAYVNKFTKTFALNPIVWLDNDSLNSGKANQCTAQETDIINKLGDFTPNTSITNAGGYASGHDTTATGLFPYNASVAYQTRGRFYTGFLAAGSAVNGSTSTDPHGGDQFIGYAYYGDSYGFKYQNRNSGNGVAFQILNGGTQTVQFLPNGDLQCQNTARVWVTFNGYGSNGPLTVTNGFNVSGITKLATGSYQIYFYNNIANANYAVAGSFGDLSSGPYSVTTSGKYVGSVVIHLTRAGVGLYDVGTVDIMIMGNNV